MNRRWRPRISARLNLYFVITMVFAETLGMAILFSLWVIDGQPGKRPPADSILVVDMLLALCAVLFSMLQVYYYLHPGREDEDAEPGLEVTVYTVDADPEQEADSPTPPDYCPGCGHPIDEHPRGLGLACDEWYEQEGSETNG